MIVAVENVFEDKTRHCPQIGGRSRFTSTAEELKAVIEKFNTPSVACCWDFGHAKCAFGKEGMLDAMKMLGKYIVCTHVHDNYYEKDLHLMPFMGDTPWEDNLAYLKEIGYQGKLSFEFAYGSLPEELLPVWLNMVYATGEYMLSLYNGKNP
jgi:sugar phosphate isomerase/epimerase